MSDFPNDDNEGFETYTPTQQAFIGFCIVAVTVITVGSTIALFIDHYNNASRSLSLRRGAQRRRFVVLFLVLAGVCYFAITTLKFIDTNARADLLGSLKDEIKILAKIVHKRTTDDDHGIGYDDFEDTNSPGSSFDQRWSAGRRILYSSLLSQWLHQISQISLKSGPDIGLLLARNLWPFTEPVAYWWSVEYWFGTLSWFYFLSYQTRLRALPWSTPILLTLLAMQFSLAGSQSLLFALMLMSPIRDTSLERWTPNRSLVLAPLWIHIMVHAAIPTTENLKSTSVAVFVTEIATFAALVAVAWIHPRRLGRFYSTAFQARSARATTFVLMTLPLVLFRTYATARAFWEASSELNTNVLWYALNFIPKEAAEDGFKDIQRTAHDLFKPLAAAGRFNAMAWDVVLSTLMLGLWSALAESDARTLLKCTLLPWLKDEEEVMIQQHERAYGHGEAKQSWLSTMKELASAKTLTRFSRSNQDEGPTTGTAESNVRKRGRPLRHRKSASGNESGYVLLRSKSVSKSRSPGRSRKSVSPSKRRPFSKARSQSRARSQARLHGKSEVAKGPLEITSAGWEAAITTWVLAALGGLGVAMTAVFGAEAADFM